jgi:hypothetical protein
MNRRISTQGFLKLELTLFVKIKEFIESVDCNFLAKDELDEVISKLTLELDMYDKIEKIAERNKRSLKKNKN